jgi:hypothetical protein
MKSDEYHPIPVIAHDLRSETSVADQLCKAGDAIIAPG